MRKFFKVHSRSKKATIYQGSCLDIMKSLESNSVDSFVTDPPYGLEFMSKAWDKGVPGPEFWSEALRIAKPGAHLLSFGGTRTYHRAVCAIEDAGWEIRDCVMWIYGSGFPKSLDVSKAIDKAGGVSPVDQAGILRRKRELAGMSRERLATMVGCTESSIRDWEEGRSRAVGLPLEFIVPSESYRAKLADILGYTSDERRIVGVSQDRRGDATVYGIGHSGEIRTGGHTDAARQWQGWGTALKPAYEPIVLARKPLVGTVAANVMEYGTGAMNIDGCRVHGGPSEGGSSSGSTALGQSSGWNAHNNRATAIDRSMASGRWPANVLHDGSEEVLAGFPETKAGVMPGRRSGMGYMGGANGTEGKRTATDAGNASRYFYCAKASKAERGEGNTHPTVKPIALMRYLTRLITPPGGVVVDNFLGSGTTMISALEEGFRCIGMELYAENCEIARNRVNARFPGTFK